ncbi:MAG: hypothetical protein FWF47_04595 [Clostridia bacterium]|nr:hypothetical protein [Clostridia bacterium]
MPASPFTPAPKNTHKVPVSVIAEYSLQGDVTPLSFRTEEGLSVSIDRVVRHMKAPALKAGGQGVCYVIRVSFHERSIIRKLFHGLDDQWFIERD